MRGFIRTVLVGCLLLGLSAAFAALGTPPGAGAEELPPGEYTALVNAGDTSLKAEHVRVALAQETTVRIAVKNDQFVLVL